ncbi:MAG: pitrilysin family protein [Bacteroidota bacterium]|nr:pitrilysin family protein [Bacteroidota bacterium]
MQSSKVCARGSSASGGKSKNFMLNAVKHLTGLSIIILLFVNTSATQTPDRTKPPDLGPPPSMKLPAIQHLKLSNGIPVVLMEKHQVPLVEVELLIRAGVVNDPKDKPGLASMTTSIMEEGAGTRNALELADAIDFLGADISAFASWHTSGVSMFTPLSKLDDALTLFGDMCLRPTFPKEELERNRKERLTTIMQWHDEPRAIASVQFSKTLFGNDHPYGKSTIGNEKSIRALKVDDLKKFHQTYFTPGNASLIVVGDISPEAILPKLEAIFGKWEGGKVEQVSFPKAQQVKERTIYLIDKPGAPQSEIRIGRIGVDRMTEDYYSLRVMNTILGGSFSSRLNQNLREQHGYTYGASSNFDFRVMPGPFLAGSAVQTAVTDSALFQFFYELNRILEPVSDEELTRAKNYLTLRYPESFQTVQQIANQLAELVAYNLPDDYFNNFTKNILAVTKEDVQRVARKYIEPEKVSIIVVGDRKTIEKPVGNLKYGKIKNLTIENVLGKAPKMDKGE